MGHEVFLLNNLHQSMYECDVISSEHNTNNSVVPWMSS